MADATLVPIGELLTRAGILSDTSLSDALSKAKERSLPLGKVLIMLGYIKTNQMMETSVPGVFAAGEASDPHFRQVITSAGMGAAAAMQAGKFLESQYR